MSLYLLSDTHFDHANIIEYCTRPFNSAEEMNATLIENWNQRVTYEDTVLFGGDIAMARSEVAIEYANKLQGQLVLLDGNHDDIDASVAPFPIMKSYYFDYVYNDTHYEFYYTHWPDKEASNREDERNAPYWASPPKWFDGWVLHGHVHNNDLENFPFVNPTDKFINLGVELLEYTPIKLEELLAIVEQGERYETISDVPSELYPFG